MKTIFQVLSKAIKTNKGGITLAQAEEALVENDVLVFGMEPIEAVRAEIDAQRLVYDEKKKKLMNKEKELAA